MNAASADVPQAERSPEALLKAHGQEIGGIAFVVLHNRADADEVVARVVALGCQSPDAPDAPQPLRLWLLGAAVREIARRSDRSAGVDPVLPAALDLARPDGSPIDRLELHGALAELPIRARTLLALRHVADLGPRELAVVMGSSEPAVGGELDAATGRLRRALETGIHAALPTETIDVP